MSEKTAEISDKDENGEIEVDNEMGEEGGAEEEV